MAIHASVATFFPAFGVWRTVALGTHSGSEEYRVSLQNAGFRLSGWAQDVLGRKGFVVSAEVRKLPLVKVSVSDLGLTRGAAYRDICDAARRHDLALCPPEVGPALRLAYGDQALDEILRIGMVPVEDSAGGKGIFALGRNAQEMWLGGEDGSPGREWPASCDFLFAGH